VPDRSLGGLIAAGNPVTLAAMATRSPAAGFPGFTKSALQFWHELAANMSREWFADHKARYEAEWVAPMTALLADAAARLAPVYKPLALGAPKILRIHRDVRFAKDKTPYKTHIGAVITVGGKKVGEGGNAALYVHLGQDEDFVGVGLYQFDAARLARWRKAVAGKPGEELARLVARLRKAGYEVGGHDDYKKVPRGFPPDHPRADLLKCKGLTGGAGEIPAGLPTKPAFADWIVDHAKALAPLVIWLDRHVR
jgi:uncharacterized protein (TIGR02453 family)